MRKADKEWIMLRASSGIVSLFIVEALEYFTSQSTAIIAKVFSANEELFAMKLIS